MICTCVEITIALVTVDHDLVDRPLPVAFPANDEWVHSRLLSIGWTVQTGYQLAYQRRPPAGSEDEPWLRYTLLIILFHPICGRLGLDFICQPATLIGGGVPQVQPSSP